MTARLVCCQCNSTAEYSKVRRTPTGKVAEMFCKRCKPRGAHHLKWAAGR